MAESIGFDEDFLQNRPIDDWRVDLCKLDGLMVLELQRRQLTVTILHLLNFAVCGRWTRK